MAAQAQQKDYGGQPLVRFMVDISHEAWKICCLCQKSTLTATADQLHNEERAFLGGNSSVGGGTAQCLSSTIPALLFQPNHSQSHDTVCSSPFLQVCGIWEILQMQTR